jgi:GGDEF domain-containing protein
MLNAAARDLAEFSGNQGNPLGLSIGVAIYEPESGESLDGLLARADAAMYAVKEAGKGSYKVAPPAPVKT